MVTISKMKFWCTWCIIEQDNSFIIERQSVLGGQCLPQSMAEVLNNSELWNQIRNTTKYTQNINMTLVFSSPRRTDWWPVSSLVHFILHLSRKHTKSEWVLHCCTLSDSTLWSGACSVWRALILRKGKRRSLMQKSLGWRRLWRLLDFVLLYWSDDY